MSRAIGLLYGAAGGAGVVQLGAPPLLVIPVAMSLAVGLDLYHDHKQKLAEVPGDD